MNKIVLTLSLLISFIALSACSSSATQAQLEQAEAQQLKAQRMTVVSSAKPANVLPAFTSFTWNDQYTQVLSAVNSEKEDEIKDYIRSEVIAYLQTKGYQFQPDPLKADLVIGFLFALEDDMADKTIQEKFGLVPGVNKNVLSDPRYKKGTFLLAVLDAQLKKVYWRSAMQGFVDLEKDKNDKSVDRMQKILHLMMGDFPEAGR
ncbi:MAG: hypothetical protein ACJAT7_002350 [Psychromonas sp.]|jgi:hypothetical protein|uniref:DUF4136 domain-containing protein n=1 Tax=Psychromonas sp. TaxID=1884585 RepID=UPI0039E5DF8B